MNARNDANGIVSGWLDEQAGRGAPDYLDEILARTIRTRQRPAWSSLERWLPVQLTFTGRLAPIPRLAWAVALLVILVLAAAALFAAGVGQRRLPHFGYAANGQIAITVILPVDDRFQSVMRLMRFRYQPFSRACTTSGSGARR